MQGVDDELENNCFICGIGKDYLDSVPHGFDIHVQKEHNLANYLYVYWYFVVFIEYFSFENIPNIPLKMFLLKNFRRM